jgi:hypothetical protein
VTESRVRSLEIGSAARGPRAALALVAAALALALAGTPTRAQDAAAAQAAAPGEDEPAFTAEQLEQMLAPIALYPDDLLSQILMASTYPLEVVQADRWVKVHEDLAPEEAEKALEEEDWDPSVKSLVAVPDVLALLSDELDWTQELGDAFISQQKDVLATVQTLRGRAKENGKLESNDEQKVEVNVEGSTQTIVIESAQPDVIYVPVYDTTVVYGYWPYPAYPPYPYYPPAYRVGAAIATSTSTATRTSTAASTGASTRATARGCATARAPGSTTRGTAAACPTATPRRRSASTASRTRRRRPRATRSAAGATRGRRASSRVARRAAPARAAPGRRPPRPATAGRRSATARRAAGPAHRASRPGRARARAAAAWTASIAAASR